GVEQRVEGSCGLAVAVYCHCVAGASQKTLAKVGDTVGGLSGDHGSAADYYIIEWGGSAVPSELGPCDWIAAADYPDVRSTPTARHSAGATRAAAADTTDAAADRSRKQRRGGECAWNPAGCAAALGTQEVSLCKTEVIARHGDVEVVLERQGKGVLNGKAQLPPADQRVNPLRVAHSWQGNIGRAIRPPEVRKPSSVSILHDCRVGSLCFLG